MSQNNQEILERLDIIIKLLAVDTIKGKEVKEQILFLHELGITNKDVAKILGKTQNTVNVTLSQFRKVKKNE